jgi:hypothetical protein
VRMDKELGKSQKAEVLSSDATNVYRIANRWRSPCFLKRWREVAFSYLYVET